MECKKIAAAYIRVSTEEQTELSPDSQLKEIQKYARQHDLELPEEYVFIDAGISGRNTAKRPSFNRMIGIAKTKPKPFDLILLWKFSRFARNREDSIVYKSMLRRECGIDVVSISEALGDDKTAVLIEALIEAMDEYYSINLSGEVKRGMLEKAERGGIVTIPSFGYKVEAGNYVIDGEKAKLVNSIFYDYLTGAGIREIAAGLNNLGIPTARGGKWENRNVEYLLRNPVYIGKIRWNPAGKTNRNYDNKNIIITQGKHEPIIDDELFNKVQERLDNTKQMFRKGEHQGARRADFMLRGLIKCSNCGSTLVQAAKGVSLQCYGYAHGKCPVSHSISIKLINEAVVGQVTRDIELDSFNVAPLTPAADNSDNINEQIKGIRKKISRAMDAYENGAYELDVFNKRKTSLEKDIEKLEARLSIKNHTCEFIQNRKDNIKSSLKLLVDPDVSDTEKNLALRQIVQKIVFDRQKNEVSIFYR